MHQLSSPLRPGVPALLEHVGRARRPKAVLAHQLRLLGVSYFERLRALARERHTLLCVGLDPDPERIEGGAAGALRHCREVVRQTEEHVCCFKPNSAFWEQYGPDGWQALLELRDEAPLT